MTVPHGTVSRNPYRWVRIAPTREVPRCRRSPPQPEPQPPWGSRIGSPLTLALTTLTTGLICGFFYTYACSVTLGLALLPDEQYIEAMQAINATVRNGCSPSASLGPSCRFSWRLRPMLPRGYGRAVSPS